MNIAKNMEAIFLAAVTLAGATLVTTAVAAVPAAKHTVTTTAQAAPIAQVSAGKMPVVVISAKRLSAAEKAALAN